MILVGLLLLTAEPSITSSCPGSWAGIHSLSSLLRTYPARPLYLSPSHLFPLATIFSALRFHRAPTLLSPLPSLAKQGTGTSPSLNCSAVICLVKGIRLGHCTAFLGGLGDPSFPCARRRSKRRNGRSGGRFLLWIGEGEELPSRKGLVMNSEYRDVGEFGRLGAGE